MDHTTLTALAGGVLGLAFGAIGWRSGFCVRGAIADLVAGQFGSARIAAYLAALAVALAGVQGLIHGGLLDGGATAHLPLGLGLAGVIVGGLLFGIGMVLSGGCGARLLVLGGGGNLRALAVLLVFGLVAYATMRGILSPLRGAIAGAGVLPLAASGQEASLATLLAEAAESERLRLLAVVWLIVAAVLAGRLAWRNGGRPQILGGAAIGLLVVASFALTGVLLQDSFEPKPAEGLSLTRGLGAALVYLLTWTGSSIDFAIAWVFGVPLGALALALLRREARLVGFTSPQQMLAYLGGGALMGLGGVLAAGCSIGHGLTGLALLGPSSLLALLAIGTGAAATLLWQRRRAVAAAVALPAAGIAAAGHAGPAPTLAVATLP